MLILVLVALASRCDSAETSLHNLERSFAQIRACMCIRRSELDDFKKSAKPVLQLASSCSDLGGRVDSIKSEIKRVRKELR